MDDDKANEEAKKRYKRVEALYKNRSSILLQLTHLLHKLHNETKQCHNDVKLHNMVVMPNPADYD